MKARSWTIGLGLFIVLDALSLFAHAWQHNVAQVLANAVSIAVTLPVALSFAYDWGKQSQPVTVNFRLRDRR